MKINANVERMTVLSAPMTSIELRAIVDALWDARKGPRWSKYIIDGRETDTKAADDPDAVVEFYPRRLTRLDHFRVCHANERSWTIGLTCHCPHSPRNVERVIEFFRTSAPVHLRGMNVMCYVSQSGKPATNVYGEFLLQISGNFVATEPAFTLHVTDFRKNGTRESRLAFFEDAIDHLGLRGEITITREGDEYRVEAVSPWQLRVSGATPAGWHPSSFYITAPIPFDDAWFRMDSALHSPMVKRIDNMLFGIRVRPDKYAHVYRQLDSLATDWSVSIYGSYADDIDPYTADASQSPDGRFPIFTWLPMGEHQGVFFQADIIPTSDGRVLEIHSNCSDMNRLLKEAESAAGVQFTPVQST